MWGQFCGRKYTNIYTSPPPHTYMYKPRPLKILQNLIYNFIITIDVRAFPSIDHSNCVDVTKCYLACLFRAQEVPKHISVRGRLNE